MNQPTKITKLINLFYTFYEFRKKRIDFSFIKVILLSNMVPIDEIKNFLFFRQSIQITNEISANLLKNVHSAIESLIKSNKSYEVLDELIKYFKFQSSINSKIKIDSVAFVLASCSLLSKEEKFSHRGIS